MTFGENLRFLRKQMNLRQQQVADILGIDRSGYSYYECDKTEPPFKRLRLLAKIFNCTMDELFNADPPKMYVNDNENPVYSPQSNPVSTFAALPRDEQNLLILYRSLPESATADVIKFMNQLKKNTEE